MKRNILLITGLLTAASVQAAEYHISTTGLDTNDGSQAKPLKTISAAVHPSKTLTKHLICSTMIILD